MKKHSLLILACAMAISLSACSTSGKTVTSPSGSSGGSPGSSGSPTPTAAGEATSAKPVTLRIAWWGGQPRNDYTLKILEMYQQKHPEVKFEPEYSNYDDYWKKLAPEAASNNLPDIIQMDTAYFTQYAEKNQLEDLTPYLQSAIDVSAISDSALSGGKIGDKLYGMNLGVNVLGFQYDPALLQKIGVDKLDENWTWDDYEKMALKAKAANLYFDTTMRPEVFFAYFLRTKGQHLYSADGTGLGYSNDALFSEYFGRYAKLVKAGDIPTPDFLAQVKGIEDDPVVKGKAIGVWQWSNQYIGLKQVAKRPLEMAMMMGPDANKGLFLKPSMYFSISKNSANKNEAAKFIDFFVNDIEVNKLIRGDRGVPVSSKVKEGLKPILTPDELKVFDFVSKVEAISSPVDPPDPVGSAQVIDLFKNITQQLANGSVTPDDAAKKFRQDATAILSKNKK